MRTSLVLLLVFSVTLNVAAAATLGYFWYQESHRPPLPPPPPPPPGEKIAQCLCLNSEQKICATKIFQETRRNTQEIQRQIMAKRQAILTLNQADHPDQAKIDILLQEIAGLQIAWEKEHIKNIQNMKALLTPEQKRKFFQVLHRHMAEGPGHFRRNLGHHGRKFISDPPPPLPACPARMK